MCMYMQVTAKPYKLQRCNILSTLFFSILASAIPSPVTYPSVNNLFIPGGGGVDTKISDIMMFSTIVVREKREKF